MTSLLRRSTSALAALLVAGLLATTARAETLTVEIDHALLLRLDSDADIVHIANPSIADVALESPRMIFVVGLQAGQTGIYILDRDGNPVVEGSVIVTQSTTNEVTLNRNTDELTYSCASRCTEVEISGQDSQGGFDTGTGTGGDNEDF